MNLTTNWHQTLSNQPFMTKFKQLEFSFPDVEKLAKEGKGSLTKKSSSEDGYETTEVDYVSNDGRVRYSKIDVTPTRKALNKVADIMALEKALYESVKTQNFEEAIKYRDQLKQLKTN